LIVSCYGCVAVDIVVYMDPRRRTSDVGGGGPIDALSARLTNRVAHTQCRHPIGKWQRGPPQEPGQQVPRRGQVRASQVDRLPCPDRMSSRLNSSHVKIAYADLRLKHKK